MMCNGEAGSHPATRPRLERHLARVVADGRGRGEVGETLASEVVGEGVEGGDLEVAAVGVVPQPRASGRPTNARERGA
jgi:hypothetical protein